MSGEWLSYHVTYPVMHFMLHTHPPPWTKWQTDRHLWKHCLPTATFKRRSKFHWWPGALSATEIEHAVFRNSKSRTQAGLTNKLPIGNLMLGIFRLDTQKEVHSFWFVNSFITVVYEEFLNHSKCTVWSTTRILFPQTTIVKLFKDQSEMSPLPAWCWNTTINKET